MIKEYILSPISFLGCFSRWRLTVFCVEKPHFWSRCYHKGLKQQVGNSKNTRVWIDKRLEDSEGHGTMWIKNYVFDVNLMGNSLIDPTTKSGAFRCFMMCLFRMTFKWSCLISQWYLERNFLLKTQHKWQVDNVVCLLVGMWSED